MTKCETVSYAVIRRLWKYIRPSVKLLVAGMLAMALAAATEAGIPMLLKPLLDHGFGSKLSHQYLLWVPTAIIGLALARGLAQYASQYLLSHVTTNILLRLRLEMFNKMIHTQAAYFMKETASKFINAIVFEVNQILTVLSTVLISLVRDSLTVLFLLCYLFYLNWRLTLIIAVILPLIGWLVSRINRRLRRLNREFQDLTNDLSYIVEEAVTGYKVVKVHNGEAYEMDRFAKMSRKLRQYAMRMTISGGLARPLTQFLASIALAIVVTIAIFQSAHDQTTVGGFVAFVTSTLLIVTPLKHLIDINQPLQRGLTAAEFIFKLIDAPLESNIGSRILQNVKGEVEYQQVSFSYQDSSQVALKNISFRVSPGQILALVGPSGSGKTTLVNLLPRFFDPSAGKILLDGFNILDYNVHDLRRQIAFVTQELVLFNDTVAANVAYGEAVDEVRILKALKAANLLEAIQALPKGIQTMIGGNGMRLSGGQRQRLAIAQAIYKDAPILILDEATSALDSESEHYVQQALETLMKGRTTLVIAHRLATIERADHILVIQDGELVEQGDHHALLREKGLYAHLHRIQFADDQST